MSEQTPKNPNFSRGKRYSPGQKAEKHGCTPWSIYNWRNQKARDILAAESQCDPNATSQQPEDSALSPTQEERHQLILALWKQQPGLGPSQIRNQLKRKGYKASVKTVREIMEDHGYIQPKARRKEHTD